MSSKRQSSDETEAILLELLVLRCRRDDAEAWRQLVRHWEKRLLYYLRRLLADERDAWDVLQQVWMAVFRNLKSLRDPRALRPWLYRIAHNRAISHRRKTRKATQLETRQEDESFKLDDLPAPDADDDDWLSEAPQLLHRALDELSPLHREAITLFFLEEMPVEEIAAVTGVPAGTVKSRLHYAKLQLRQIFERSETP